MHVVSKPRFSNLLTNSSGSSVSLSNRQGWMTPKRLPNTLRRIRKERLLQAQELLSMALFNEAKEALVPCLRIVARPCTTAPQRIVPPADPNTHAGTALAGVGPVAAKWWPKPTTTTSTESFVLAPPFQSHVDVLGFPIIGKMRSKDEAALRLRQTHWEPYAILGLRHCFCLSLSGGLCPNQTKSPRCMALAALQILRRSQTNSLLMGSSALEPAVCCFCLGFQLVGGRL